MSLLKLFGNKEVYNHVPAECEYYVLCESQYGTQQCSMKRDDCLKCDRRQSYINENNMPSCLKCIHFFECDNISESYNDDYYSCPDFEAENEEETQ